MVYVNESKLIRTNVGPDHPVRIPKVSEHDPLVGGVELSHLCNMLGVTITFITAATTKERERTGGLRVKDDWRNDRRTTYH